MNYKVIKNKNLDLFLSMLKIGLFTFGGGYAMISILENEFVEKKQWITEDEFMNMVTIAESTPGPIAVNSSTYIGYKVSKVLGSIIGTLGMVLPSFIIIFIISLFFDKFLSIKIVSYAFRGIQMAVIYLIFQACIKFFKNIKKSFINYLLLIITVISYILITLFSINFSTIYFILIGMLIGIIIYFITKNKKTLDNNINNNSNNTEDNKK